MQPLLITKTADLILDIFPGKLYPRRRRSEPDKSRQVRTRLVPAGGQRRADRLLRDFVLSGRIRRQHSVLEQEGGSLQDGGSTSWKCPIHHSGKKQLEVKFDPKNSCK